MESVTASVYIFVICTKRRQSISPLMYIYMQQVYARTFSSAGQIVRPVKRN